MERLLVWIRENPQLSAIALFLTITVLVLGGIGIAMSRSGASLRPIIWFVGFLAIVGGPQGVVHLLDGLVLRKARATNQAKAATGAKPEGRSTFAPVPWATVFGPKADPALITDAKRGLGAVLGEATEAKLSFNSSGESALAARFPSVELAQRALNTYGTFFAFANVTGSDATGWTAQRHQGQGEWVHVVTAGDELYAWTAASRDAVLANRIRVLGAVNDAAPPVSSRPRPPGTEGPELVSERLSKQVGLMSLFLGVSLISATLWFFKGSAWAARVDASTAVRAAAESSLRRDILAINQANVPTDVTTRPDGTIEINWRYADARWFDLMRVHQMKRTHRLVLHFNEARRTVRVREYWGAFDASLGAGNLNLQWKAATGIQFFSYEHTRVIGVQFDANGKPTGELSKAFTFDLQMLKSPVIEAVTKAGWHWQPVVWNMPESLRWLSE